MDAEFEEISFDKVEDLPYLEDKGQESTEESDEHVWQAWQVAWDEVRRRHLYGQNVIENLEHLTGMLISHMV